MVNSTEHFRGRAALATGASRGIGVAISEVMVRPARQLR